MTTTCVTMTTTYGTIGDVDEETNKRTGQVGGMWPLVQPPPCSFSRDTYWGSFLFNLGTSILPPFYQLLSTVYMAQIDSSTIGTIATYTYLGVVGEIINEGLPRASYRVFGDRRKDHYAAMWTMLIFQMLLTLLLASSMCIFAPFLTEHFAAYDIRAETVTYIRISSWSVFFVSIEYASGIGLRAMDYPDIPLKTMLTKVSVNMILDFLFLSSFRVVDIASTTTQASIRLCCDAVAASAALMLYMWRSRWRRPRFVKMHLYTLYLYGRWTFLESLVRNVIYLACVKEMVQLGKDYGAAWSNFNTIRWGIIMCFNTAAEGSGSTFLGHRWHYILSMSKRRKSVTESTSANPEAPEDEEIRFAQGDNCKTAEFIDNAVEPVTISDTWIKKCAYLVAPAVWSALLILVIEIFILVAFSVGVCKHYALWISGNDTAVADLTVSMWNRIDWTYILWSVSMQLTAILTATAPKWTLMSSACLNVLYIMPWAIYLSVERLAPPEAWKMNAFVFGGVNVLNFASIWFFLVFWLRETKKQVFDGSVDAAESVHGSPISEEHDHLS